MSAEHIAIEGDSDRRAEFQVCNCSESIQNQSAYRICRWKLASTEDETYTGVMANCVWQLKQDDHHLIYCVVGEIKESIDAQNHRIRFKVSPRDSDASTDKYYESLLRSYFRLDIDLAECYRQWSSSHSHFAENANKFYAIRVLDQDPIENLFSFICSQNNHISR